jgi:hypothetical protein
VRLCEIVVRLRKSTARYEFERSICPAVRSTLRFFTEKAFTSSLRLVEESSFDVALVEEKSVGVYDVDEVGAGWSSRCTSELARRGWVL